jgi:hypothetical protein
MIEEQQSEYLDIHLIDPNKVVIFEKWVDDNDDNESDKSGDRYVLHRKIGLLSEKEGEYHRYCGFNQFTKQTFPIPSESDEWSLKKVCERYEEFKHCGYEEFIKKESIHYDEWIKRHICDPTAKIFTPKEEHPINQHQNSHVYKTLFNGGTGYIVVVEEQNNKVYIYGRSHDVIPDEYLNVNDESYIIFDRLVK